MTGTNFSSHSPSHSNLDYNLGQNKMEQQANPFPPTSPAKSRMKLRKSQNVLFSYPRFGAGEEEWYKFPISSVQDILSARVALCMDFALHGGDVFSLKLRQPKEFLGFTN